MNIYVEILLIYCITFLVSMFVALIIWVLAKLIDNLQGESFSLKRFINDFRLNINSGKEQRKQFMNEFRAKQVKTSDALINIPS